MSESDIERLYDWCYSEIDAWEGWLSREEITEYLQSEFDHLPPDSEFWLGIESYLDGMY